MNAPRLAFHYRAESHPYPHGMVEAWSQDYPLVFPVAVCYLSSCHATIEYVQVNDDWRRMGVASALLAYTLRLFPGVQPTPAISAGGEALLRKFWADVPTDLSSVPAV